MGKNTDKLGTAEAFKAPWENDAGETEIDKGRLKSFIYNLSLGKAKAEDASEDAAAEVVAAKAELKVAKDEVAAGDPTGKIADLEKKVAEAEGKAGEATVALTRYEVAVDKGLTPAQAKYLQGTKKDDLEKSANDILKDFGVTPAVEETDDEREEREEAEAEAAITARETPTVRRGLVNPADPQGQTPTEPNYEELVAGMNRRII